LQNTLFSKYFSQNAGDAPPKNQHLRMVSWPNITKEKEKLWFSSSQEDKKLVHHSMVVKSDFLFG
jgi:hypothetical protein